MGWIESLTGIFGSETIDSTLATPLLHPASLSAEARNDEAIGVIYGSLAPGHSSRGVTKYVLGRRSVFDDRRVIAATVTFCTQRQGVAR